jgi:hypothetical protein
MFMTGKTIFYYGHDKPLPEQIPLQAGPLSLIYEAGAIRYVRLGKVEILRGVYSAVRDHNWDTIPATLSNVQSEIKADSFRISYRAEHKQGGIHFIWAGVISGESNGTVTFEMDGECRSDFQRNRIGFCVLHPASCAGLACSIEHVDGSSTQGNYPKHISPHQPFMDIRTISHDVMPGVTVAVRMEGDTFEMEDQRNWTDASYKTYCTPLAQPFPVEVTDGQKIAQKITISLEGTLPNISADDEGLTFTISDTPTHPLPRIGLGVASHGEPLTGTEITRLKALNLNHLRADLHLSRPDLRQPLQRASDEASALGISLELALHLTGNAEQELRAFRALIDDIRPNVSAWLIYHVDEKSTRQGWAKLARQIIGDYAPDALLGAGTNAYFTELNRERPPVDVLDVVSYSLNPQVHAFDNASLVETLPMQAQAIRSTNHFTENLPLAVSPITLQPRFNPNATGPEPEPAPGELPPQVDVRQMSLFGAGWTVGSIKYISEGGAHSVTYYETTGWRGVMERENGSPLADNFQSIAGGVFPLYHILADVGEFAGGQLIPTISNDPLTIDGLAMVKDGRTGIVLANFSAQPQRITIHNLPAEIRLKYMNETNVQEAMQNPEAFRRETGTSIQTELELLPFGILRIDY